MANKCNKCGIDVGSSFLYDDMCWSCRNASLQPPTCPIIGYGWECPRCHKINAPWMSSCDCPPTYQYSYTTTTGPVTVCNEPPPINWPKNDLIKEIDTSLP